MISDGHYAMSDKALVVTGAGTITMEKGVITSISNWSGHYKPTAVQMKSAIAALQKAG